MITENESNMKLVLSIRIANKTTLYASYRSEPCPSSSMLRIPDID
jgi:hypothetical protein